MSSERDFDRIVMTWLGDGPTELADRVLDAALEEIHVTRQRRAPFGVPWRFPAMHPRTRLAVAAVAVLAVGAVAVTVLGPSRQSVGGPTAVPSAPPAASPSPSPTPLPGLTQTFTSTTHGLAISYPAGWTTKSATAVWRFGTIIPSAADPALDRLIAPGDVSTISMTSQAIPTDTVQWVRAYHDLNVKAIGASAAGGDPATWQPVPVGNRNQTGLLYEGTGFLEAVVALGDRGYVFTLFRTPIQTPSKTSVSQELFLAILASAVLDPASAVPEFPAPSPPVGGLSVTLTTYESARYQYSIGYPANWSVREAKRSLRANEAPWATSDAIDFFSGPASGLNDPGIIVAAAEVPQGTTIEEWAASTVRRTCGTPSAKERVDIGGELGSLLTYASCFQTYHLWAVVLHGTSAFHIVWINYPGTEASDRLLFEDVLATFTFID